MTPARKAALKRYMPLLVVLAAQGLLVLTLPSVAGPKTTVAAGGTRTGAGTTAGAVSGATPTTGSAGGSPGSVAAADGAGAGGDAVAGSSGAAAAGDTSHCVGDRQFDPAIDYFAPACVAKFVGGNGGATYGGVTGDTIKIVQYFPQGNAAVDTSLKAQGLYVSIDQFRQWDASVAEFINSHYELYGRKVSIEVVQGTCSTIPPDTACLRAEMRHIVADKAPFMFEWTSPLTSAPFDELSSLGVVNFGGLMFTDEFSQARRPYHWDVHMSGTAIADHFGQWWCSQMSGQPAAYSAGSALSGTNGRTRVLGVIGTNDPENIAMREELDRVLHGCGDRVAHTYDASNDLSTAAAQKSASVASMRQSPESTTVLCLCNPVGAQFVYNEMQTQQYYPEIVYAGTVYTDLDDAGQSFMSSAACPTGTNCTFADALGLSSSEPREPVGSDAAARVWAATGRAGQPPFPGAQLDWDYWELMASLLQQAGPTLNPENLEAGAFAAGYRGGGATGHVRRGFEAGSHAWNHDMAITYWDPRRTSPFNGKPGTFVTVGSRIDIGGYPSGPPDVPVSRS